MKSTLGSLPFCTAHLGQQALDIRQLRGESSVLAQSGRERGFALVQLALQTIGPEHGRSQIPVLLLGTGTDRERSAMAALHVTRSLSVGRRLCV